MENRHSDLLRRRFATRAIAMDPLPEEVIEELIEAARLTPSCFNNQPWRFLFLSGEEALDKGGEALSAGNKQWASRAPLLIIGHARSSNDCQLPDGREYFQFDLGMAVMNIILAATQQNLVARPMAGFSPDKVRELFDLQAEDEPLVMMAVGYPSDDESHLPDDKKGLGRRPRERKPAAEIFESR